MTAFVCSEIPGEPRSDECSVLIDADLFTDRSRRRASRGYFGRPIRLEAPPGARSPYGTVRRLVKAAWPGRSHVPNGASATSGGNGSGDRCQRQDSDARTTLPALAELLRGFLSLFVEDRERPRGRN